MIYHVWIMINLEEIRKLHYKYGIVPSYIGICKLINNILKEFKYLVNFDKKTFKNLKGEIKEKKIFVIFNISQITDYIINLIDGQYYDL